MSITQLNLITKLNTKRCIANFILSMVFAVFVPLYFFNLLYSLDDSFRQIFIWDSIVRNGILFVVVYTIYGIFQKQTFIRFFIGIGYIILLVYFYTVGSNIFTLFLPHSDFGELYIEARVILSLSITINYVWFVTIVLVLKFLNIARHKAKGLERQKETFELKALD